MASRGEDISKFFTHRFTVVRPVRRVNVDLTQGMLSELDESAAGLLRQSSVQPKPIGNSTKRWAS